ncbi:MAG: isopentenyl-diphosphate Delta-isomerase [Coriobacteriales bacterium]|nr:isopentenyl-diphosphate Delta-isomerase [Coriobacteriales bacterium]
MTQQALPYLDPIPMENGTFVHDDRVPEGCCVVDLVDDIAYAVEHRDYVYATREVDGEPYELHIYAIVPRQNDPLHAREARPLPCVVFCQGSAWHKQWLYGRYAQQVMLAQRGFVVLSAEYRPSDVAPFPAQAQDFKTAVRWTRAHAEELGGDSERIAVWGDSSGAHTAMMVGFTADEYPNAPGDPEVTAQVSAIVDWYGPTSLKHMNCVPSSQDHTQPASPEGMVLGGCNVTQNQDKADAASPLNYVHEQVPPVLIMHGGRDQLVAFDQSVRLYERLREVGAAVEFYKVENGLHGSDGFCSRAAVELVAEFLERTLGCATEQPRGEDLLILVDEQDRQVGTVTKSWAHREGLLHRAFSVFLFDGDRLLLQRRARGKYHSGGLWTNSCCSHPRDGETLLQAVPRRLAQELGVYDVPCYEVGTFTYRHEFAADLFEHEFDHVFVGEYAGACKPDADEVDELRWERVSQVRAELAEHPERFTAWFAQAFEIATRAREGRHSQETS